MLGWTDVGSALPGTTFPSAFGAGPLATGTANLLDLSGSIPGATAFLVAGADQADLPFKGGTLVPQPTVIVPVPLDATGHGQVPILLAAPITPGVPLFFQFWIPDAGGPAGFQASQAVTETTG